MVPNCIVLKVQRSPNEAFQCRAFLNEEEEEERHFADPIGIIAWVDGRTTANDNEVTELRQLHDKNDEISQQSNLNYSCHRLD